jgi:hypothetical protein
MPPVPADDPFADDDAGAAPNAFGVDHDARAELFGITQPPAQAQTSPPSSPFEQGSGLVLQSAPLSAPAEPPRPKRARPTVPIVRAMAAAVQLVVVLLCTVVAVVVGRGGDPTALLSLDAHGAFKLKAVPENGLNVDAVSVTRRVSRFGVPLAIVSGVVHNAGAVGYDDVVVTVEGDGIAPDGKASAVAWRVVDAGAVDDINVDADVAAIAAARPSSPQVSVGDRAPFLVVARVDGALGPVRVSAARAP